ncbi:MAG: PQQ-dependent sugar dehydrogenase [Gammaproteobacteria bacterium]
MNKKCWLVVLLNIALGAHAAKLAPDVWRSVAPQLPEGFTATVFHPELGAARHMAVRDNGDVYVARSFLLDVPMFDMRASNGAIVALRDVDGDGEADIVKEFGPATITTGVEIYDGYLYFSSDLAVYRIALDDQLVPFGVHEPIAGGFPMQRSHGDRTFTFDMAGNLYVNAGVPTNVCETERMKRESPGIDPCPYLDRSGGIWKFAADEQLQDQVRDGVRYVTGTRNVLAMEWNPWSDKLYFVMHGRDSIGMLWPNFFSREDNAELPAEEFHVAEEGDNFGWPYSYYDPRLNKRMQSPEYGGDGKKAAKGDYRDPLIGFPAHWAPMDLLFHSGNNLPEKYAQGAFIIFHGSWNRMPFEQQGFKVVFVPMRDGKVTGDWEVFADGFIGQESIKNPLHTAYRPTGLAEGPEGEIYISEDRHGRIWRVTYEEPEQKLRPD